MLKTNCYKNSVLTSCNNTVFCTPLSPDENSMLLAVFLSMLPLFGTCGIPGVMNHFLGVDFEKKVHV